MEIVTTQKYIRMSPKKMRPVAELIKKMPPYKAVETLPFIGKDAAPILAKVLKTALAIAGERGISKETLFIKEIQIGEGPRLKRGTPISRGRWHPILKRMSHIRVVLATRNDQGKKLINNKQKKKMLGKLSNLKNDK